MNPTLPFRKVAVLGAGTMGAQIAAHCANAGLSVDLLDITPAAIGKPGAPNSLVEKAWAALSKMNPSPFFNDAAKSRVRLGNFDEHFDRIKDADLIIEAVVERLDVKRGLMERIEATASDAAVIGTNTSGIPIREIGEGRSEGFRKRLLGTHFFNPPRYLKLLELVPTADTDPAVVERVARFGRVHLGKGIVVANDVPYFVGNRIGTYAILGAMETLASGAYTMEELDALTGPLIGHAKSATFRTADVVGLDVLRDVTNNLYAKTEGDESRERFRVPPLLDQLVQNGALGAKTKAGFYQKVGKDILSINPQTGRYEAAKPLDLPGLDDYKKIRPLAKRYAALFNDEGRIGTYIRSSTLDTLAYAARRIPEITASPASVDNAIKWGFGWEMGPFEIWDALGFGTVLQKMDEAGIALPDWVGEMKAAGVTQFYRDGGVYVPGQGYATLDIPKDELRLAAINTDASKEVWKNDEAALLDLGDGVVLYEFRSKANSLGFNVMNGLVECIARVENDPNLRGLVIGNEGANFAVGANLGEVAMMAAGRQWDVLEQAVAGFQQAVQRIRYAAKPVVPCLHQQALGGGCEIGMAVPHTVAAAESYIGLVELGVGLIPAGTGTTRLAALASRRAPQGFASEVFAYLSKYFEQVASAKVATSARMAQDYGFLAETATVVMNADRRLYVARQEVLRLSEEGYLPPPVETSIQVLGRPASAAFEVAIKQFLDGKFVSEYDAYLGKRFAHALAGGDFSGPQFVHEDYLLDLEREVFMGLLGEAKTQERITGLLLSGKPVRN